MIYLTRLDGTEVVVNSDLIVTVERTPDTMLTLVTGGRILVKEPVQEVVDRSVGYRHRIFRGPGLREIVVPADADRGPERE
jgi:flagellar protein FlbD